MLNFDSVVMGCAEKHAPAAELFHAPKNLPEARSVDNCKLEKHHMLSLDGLQVFTSGKPAARRASSPFSATKKMGRRRP